jgi:hypothetical protein
MFYQIGFGIVVKLSRPIRENISRNPSDTEPFVGQTQTEPAPRLFLLLMPSVRFKGHTNTD